MTFRHIKELSGTFNCRMFPMVAKVADPSLETLGPILAALRVSRGLSTPGLRKAADVDLKTISTMEAGTRWPQDTTRDRIEKALSIPAGWINAARQSISTGQPLKETYARAVEDTSAYQRLLDLGLIPNLDTPALDESAVGEHSGPDAAQEIAAMDAVAKAMGPLQPAEQERVLRWALARFVGQK